MRNIGEILGDLRKDPNNETLKKELSEAMSGENHPNYGKKFSEETKKKISESMSGENNPMYGVSLKGKDSPNYGRKHSEETKKKMSESHSGENNPLYGVKGKEHPLYGSVRPKEVREKQSETMKEVWRRKKADPNYKPPEPKHKKINFTHEIITAIIEQTKIMVDYPLKDGRAYIYALGDEKKEIVYIGKAVDLRRRYNAHINDYRHTFNRKTCWVVGLLRKSKVPFIKVLEECNLQDWEARETYWIKYYRDQGIELLNMTDGGDGLQNPSPEVTKRRIQTRRDNGTLACSEETKKLLSNRMSGEKHPQYGIAKSEDTRSKISESLKENHPLKGKTFSEEHKARISIALEGNKNASGYQNTLGKTWSLSEETKQRQSKAKSGLNHPFYGKSLPEKTKKKLSDSVKESWKKRRKKLNVRVGDYVRFLESLDSEEEKFLWGRIIKDLGDENYFIKGSWGDMDVNIDQIRKIDKRKFKEISS